MLKGFKEFISRGNVMDLAIAVVLGAAFTAVVNAFTNGILMNLIAALVGRPNFDQLSFRIGRGVIQYGRFLTACVNFLLVAIALYALVRGIQRASRRHAPEPREEDDHSLLEQIRDALVHEPPHEASE